MVASIAVISSFAVNYMLEKFKDVRDRNLREEMKERFEASIRENRDRIRQLEGENDGLRLRMIGREDVEKIVGERLEQMENGQVVGEAK